nr:alpha-glucosidase [Caldimonas mangrovi]
MAGVTTRLGYIASLGVDAIWICPFYPSPMKDFGYDVANHCDVDPRFGTLADFDVLVQVAHRLGLRVLIDLVLSHTSDQHPWFEQSRASRTGPMADWYVWADPIGSIDEQPQPPNNWVSLFGGSAWQWDVQRQQFYLHNFLGSQPDLNYHHPAVQQAAAQVVRFWLDRGVDGFRIDTANYYFHDAQLRSNPPATHVELRADGLPEGTAYAMQRHLHDKSQPENLAFMEKLRAVVDRYPGRCLLAEIGDDDALACMAEYTRPGRLHMAYSFHLLGPRFSAGMLAGILNDVEGRMGDGWPCWSIGNHDVPRVASRWGLQAHGGAPLRVLMAMLLCLRGTACIYQGEELGLSEVDVAYDNLQDPFGLTHWPEHKGRDGCRTPMPWDARQRLGGFTQGERTWLPTPPEHLERCATRQEVDPGSLLHAYRRFLSWRGRQPALVRGNLQLLTQQGNVIGWMRSHGEQRIVAAFNLGPEAAHVPWHRIGVRVHPLVGHGFETTTDDEGIRLPPWGAYFGAAGL